MLKRVLLQIALQLSQLDVFRRAPGVYSCEKKALDTVITLLLYSEGIFYYDLLNILHTVNILHAMNFCTLPVKYFAHSCLNLYSCFHFKHVLHIFIPLSARFLSPI